MITINLQGKTALVTGGSGELGRVMVRTLAAAGADVIVHCHRNRDMAEALVDEVTGDGRRACAVQADVTAAASVEAMREEVKRAVGMPDIIVANAVIQYDWTTVLDQPVDDFVGQFRSCVLQSVLLAKMFIPRMVKNKWGRIIGINTECTMQCSETQAAYVAGKRGMDGVYRVLAREVGSSGITVNQIAPGWTISENQPDSKDAKGYRDQVPLQRRGTDQEIANAVAFLASDLSGFITGAFIPVCGGNVMPTV